MDRRAMLKALAEHNAAAGFVPVPGATAQHARELMLAQGLRPEDCEFSRGIIAMREDGFQEAGEALCPGAGYGNGGRHF